MNKIPPIDAPHTIKLIEDFIKIRVSEAGAKGVVIGLSGGIDSAVVASIAVRALDSEKVFTLFLPSNTTPNSDLKDAKSLCSQLSVKLTVINIQKLINIYSEDIQEKEDPSLLEWANFKPRIRQTVLYFFANRLNLLVCGAGNKSELMIGYFTKFGDGAADILPIGDVYKTHVFQLGKYLNVPKNILTKAPSAGLWEGQTDEAEIGMSYSQLDSILYGIERFQTDSEVSDYLQISIAEVKKVRSKLYQSEHKRRGPLIFKLGIRTPNIDWRIPLIKPSDI
ncbi:MAG: NAD+ synthase [Candidatus Heimdallarchaeota archaeon]|nr:MAG: NAD+ synthase [Candidatus Heimdallarchaeota archaeon]